MRLTTAAASLLGSYILIYSPAAGRAACSDDSVWSGPQPMPVYLNANLVSICGASAGNCSGYDDIRWSITKALEQWTDETGADFEVKYAGLAPVLPFTAIPNAVHIYVGDPCPDDQYAYANWDAARTEGRIRLCPSNDVTGTLRWRPDAGHGSAFISIVNVMHMELGHLVGMLHSEGCPPPASRSAMLQYYMDDASHLFKGDYEWLQAQFGFRTPQVGVRDTYDFLTWNSVSVTPPTQASSSATRFSITGALQGTYAFIVFADRATRRLNFTKYSGAGWQFATSPVQYSSFQPSATAQSDTAVALQWIGGLNEATGLQHIYEITSTNARAAWSAVTQISNSQTTSNGVNAAYDPASGKTIRIWRGGSSANTNNHQIFYRAGTGAVQTLGTSTLSSDTPTIACGPVAVAGLRTVS